LPAYLTAIERGSIDPRGVPRVVVDRGATATIDGGLALGQVVGRVAADEASGRARRFGIACVAVRRCGHVGRLAHVAERIAASGQVGIVVANDAGAGQTVAPPGACEARLSTNPLAVAVPRASGPPFSLDMATSVVSHGKVRMRRDQHEEVPADWEIDGLLQFLGGYKGLGLALAVEILAGIVSGAGSSNAELQEAPEVEQGMLLIAIDIARFRPIDEVEREIDDLAAYVRSAPLARAARPLVLPGERAAEAIGRNQAAGVHLAPTVLVELRTACARLGVSLPTPAAGPPPR
jgi:hydroxycarboxylate dehydrogenase B